MYLCLIVSVVTKMQASRKMYLYPKGSRPTVGPTQPHFPEGKWGKSKANHSTPPRGDVKNTVTAPCIFSWWCFITHRDDFTLLFSSIYLLTVEYADDVCLISQLTVLCTYHDVGTDGNVYISRRNGEVGNIKVFGCFAYVIYPPLS